MMYIGFSKQTYKVLARILCKQYRHCAPLIFKGNQGIMYQFVARKKIVLIKIRKQDMVILKHFGWLFIPCNKQNLNKPVLTSRALTCVQFTKQVIGIKNIKIQTPDVLLKYLTTK